VPYLFGVINYLENNLSSLNHFEYFAVNFRKVNSGKSGDNYRSTVKV
jgi:hypothetical protein